MPKPRTSKGFGKTVTVRIPQSVYWSIQDIIKREKKLANGGDYHTTSKVIAAAIDLVATQYSGRVMQFEHDENEHA